MDDRSRELSEECLRRLAAAVRASQLYSARHPIIARNIQSLAAAVGALHALRASTTLGIIGDEVVVDDLPLGRVDALGDIMRRLQGAGIDRIVIDRGVEHEELVALVQGVASIEARKTPESSADDFPTLAHIRIGRIQIEPHVEEDLAEMATIRRLYSDAVSAAAVVWESAMTEHQPDPGAARAMIDGLARAVAQNRPALVALTALKQYDNYTFTHMVNVAILTMAQARGLGIEDHQLREFGVAALMHDIGKVRTPAEILQKAEALTDSEFAIMKRHTIDGAEILRQTPDISALAPVVAFEHHLRLDGTGYPDGVARESLNLCTMLCSIADVYDAMRSQRRYQQSFPTERILEVLKRNDGMHFDQHLVRRFVQLLGIYPVGNLVALDTGEVAVVAQTHAPDPYRPKVRVLFNRLGERLHLTYDVNLWTQPAGGDAPSSIKGPLDAADYGIDPLTFI